jgi:hypothetical protein
MRAIASSCLRLGSSPADDVSTHISPLANRRTRTSSSGGGSGPIPSPFSPAAAATAVHGQSEAPSSTPAIERSELLALLQATGPSLAKVGSASNAELVQIQRVLAGTMAAVTQEMQDRLLR